MDYYFKKDGPLKETSPEIWILMYVFELQLQIPSYRQVAGKTT